MTRNVKENIGPYLSLYMFCETSGLILLAFIGIFIIFKSFSNTVYFKYFMGI